MIQLHIGNTVGFTVKGSYCNEEGKPQKFAFMLKAKRLLQEEMSQFFAKDGKNSETSVTDFLQGIVQGWSGVQDEQGQPAPFSAEALAQLLALPGMPSLILSAYVANVGVAGLEKN